MLETLKQKLLSWTPEAAASFYGNVDSFTSVGNSIWEKTSTGWFLYSSVIAEYHDLNGHSYTLQLGDKTDALNAKQQYAEYAIANDLIRIETLVDYEIISIYGCSYTYSEHARPYNTHGISILNLINVTTNKTETVLDVVTKFFKGLDDLFIIMDGCSGTLYPKEVLVESFFYEPSQNKFFFAGNFEFDATREDSLLTHNSIIGVAGQYLNDVANSNLNIQTDINNFVNSECTILRLL